MNQIARERFAAGLDSLGLKLTSDELGKFSTFAAELKKWNTKINLTAIKDDEEIAVKHFIDSLTLLRMIQGGGSLLDIGSGGGFPAIPVKIVRHRLEVVSVDAVEKKILFQRHVARTLRLTDFTAIHARAEELAPRYCGHFRWVVSRAFADIPTFARLALPLLDAEGVIVAMKGKGGSEEAEAARKPLAEMGLAIAEIVEFPLPVAGDGRSLIKIIKI